MEINLLVNGEKKTYYIEEDDYLLEVLRADGYLSIKKGCDTGTCGVCTVLVNGNPLLSCSYLAARANGQEITTIEGVQEEAELVGQLIVSEGADQCGYCTPSLVLTTIAMKRELENPSKEEINHYLSGNLCRCTGYQGQMRGIFKYMGVE